MITYPDPVWGAAKRILSDARCMKYLGEVEKPHLVELLPQMPLDEKAQSEFFNKNRISPPHRKWLRTRLETMHDIAKISLRRGVTAAEFKKLAECVLVADFLRDAPVFDVESNLGMLFAGDAEIADIYALLSQTEHLGDHGQAIARFLRAVALTGIQLLRCSDAVGRADEPVLVRSRLDQLRKWATSADTLKALGVAGVGQHVRMESKYRIWALVRRRWTDPANAASALRRELVGAIFVALGLNDRPNANARDALNALIRKHEEKVSGWEARFSAASNS